MNVSPIVPHFFYPRNAFSMGKSKYRSNEARGPIVAVKSLNDVPREQLQAKKLQNDVTPNSDPYKHKKTGISAFWMGIYAWLRVLHIISQQRCEIERWFQRTTYRKLHIRSPMVTWLMTSRDPKTHYGVKNSGKIREEVYSNGLYALSISAKINDLGWPWRAITHSVSKHMRIRSPPRQLMKKSLHAISDEDVAQCL